MSSRSQNKSRFTARTLIIIIGLCSIFTFLPLVNLEAQELTNQTAKNMQTSNITKATPLSCDAIRLENTSSLGSNFSSVEAVVDIRCHLEEARHAIAADAADSALRQINEADMTLIALFGNNSGGGELSAGNNNNTS